MILPNGNNAKYIKVVTGIFVLFTIISPIINKFTNVSTFENIDSYIDDTADNSIAVNANINNDDAIKNMYEENLKIDIKTKISQKGYTVGNIDLEILNNEEYTLNKITLKISARNENNITNKNSNATTIVENIENVRISIGGNKEDKEKEPSIITESEKRKLVEYLSSVYEVNENNIVIS